MISWTQIAAAAIITGISVALAARAARWPTVWILAAAALSAVLIALWRGLSNALGLNGDFLPAISVGDVGCLVAGALGPAALARFVDELRTHQLRTRQWLPALVGGVVGFVVNVVIL